MPLIHQFPGLIVCFLAYNWHVCISLSEMPETFFKDKESVFFKDTAHRDGKPELLIDSLIRKS